MISTKRRPWRNIRSARALIIEPRAKHLVLLLSTLLVVGAFALSCRPVTEDRTVVVAGDLRPFDTRGLGPQ